MHVLFCVDGTDPRGDHRREGKEAQQTQTLLKAHIEVFDTRIMHTTARVVVDDLMLASNVRCSKYIHSRGGTLLLSSAVLFRCSIRRDSTSFFPNKIQRLKKWGNKTSLFIFYWLSVLLVGLTTPTESHPSLTWEGRFHQWFISWVLVEIF